MYGDEEEEKKRKKGKEGEERKGGTGELAQQIKVSAAEVDA